MDNDLKKNILELVKECLVCGFEIDDAEELTDKIINEINLNRIYIIKHGYYEDNKITLVTHNIEKAVKHLINYSDGFEKEMDGIEVWENDKLLVDYGGLNIHLINNIKRESVLVGSEGWKEKLEIPQISIDNWKEIMEDMIKFIDEAEKGENIDG